MNSHQQEQSAKHHIRWKKAVLLALGIGAIFLFVSHGIPWISSGAPDSIMGRTVIGSPVQGAAFAVAGAHLALALVYGLVIAAAIYRFNVFPSMLIAVAVGLAFYGLNALAFRQMTSTPAVAEIPALVTHLAFSVFFAAAYKGAAVPAANRPAPPDEN